MRSNRRAVVAEMHRKLDRKMRAIGTIVVNNVKLEIRSNGLIDTGRLINSITYLVESGAVYIGTNVEYAVFLELGTINIRPYSFLRNGALKSKAQIVGVLKAA